MPETCATNKDAVSLGTHSDRALIVVPVIVEALGGCSLEVWWNTTIIYYN